MGDIMGVLFLVILAVISYTAVSYTHLYEKKVEMCRIATMLRNKVAKQHILRR